MNSAVRTIAIASDTLTVTTFDNDVTVDTEGAAASDDLSTINGTARGQRLTLTLANNARAVTLKDGVGNLRLAGDFIMNNITDTIDLWSNGTLILELSRSDNA